MQKNFKNMAAANSDIINKIESQGTQFYRHCLEKSNQFSAKFILNKRLKEYQQHVSELWTEIEDLQVELPDLSDEILPEPEIIFNRLENEFEVENLNFVEATKLAIRMMQESIHYYKLILKSNNSTQWDEIINRILSTKQKYLNLLDSEYERLKYKKK